MGVFETYDWPLLRESYQEIFMNGTGAKIKNFADACSKCARKVLEVCWLFLVVHSYLSMPCLFYF